MKRPSARLDSRIRGVVRKVIRETFGSKASHIHRETGGLSNVVFTVEHASGHFIVRLNPEPAQFETFQKENWAVASARRAGVPVPEILKIGREPMPYMILAKCHGEPALSRPDKSRILHQLGGYAAQINSIRTNGFGESFDWADSFVPRRSDWQEFLYADLNLDHRLKVLRTNKMLGHQQIRKVGTALENAWRKGRTSALNHGDLRLKNVIVDRKDNIAVILDWEHCISSLAPEWELSLALHDLSIDEKHWFLDGYGIRLQDLASIAPAMKALNIINYVAEIERLAKSGNKKELAFCRIRLGGILDLYSL